MVVLGAWPGCGLVRPWHPHPLWPRRLSEPASAPAPWRPLLTPYSLPLPAPRFLGASKIKSFFNVKLLLLKIKNPPD